MKKIITVLLSAVLVLTLAACTDRKTYPTEVTVYFFTANSGAVTVPALEDVEPGSTIPKPEDPTRNGFDFVGWFKDISLTAPWVFETDTVGEKSLILYAKWQSRPYVITYVLGGGEFRETDVVPVEYTTGQIVIFPIPRKTGYSFRGWYKYEWIDESSTKPGDNGFQSVPESSAEDLTLFAHWEARITNITFNVNYPLATGAPARPNSVALTYDKEIKLPVLENTASYTFKGWNTKADGTGDYLVNGELYSIVRNSLTIYAIWE